MISIARYSQSQAFSSYSTSQSRAVMKFSAAGLWSGPKRCHCTIVLPIVSGDFTSTDRQMMLAHTDASWYTARISQWWKAGFSTIKQPRFGIYIYLYYVWYIHVDFMFFLPLVQLVLPPTSSASSMRLFGRAPTWRAPADGPGTERVQPGVGCTVGLYGHIN